MRSTECILTTHACSLPRLPHLFEMLGARSVGRTYDQEDFTKPVRTAVAEMVRKQVDATVDAVCDREQGRSSFFGHVTDRLTGCETKESEGRQSAW